MKVIKNVALVLCVGFLLLGLCGCKSAPKEKEIGEAIAAELTEEYEQPVTLKELKITKSMQEEKEYSVLAEAVVEYAGAAWTGIYELEYTKYDQGWMLDSFDVEDEDLKEVLSIPTEEELYNMVGGGTNGKINHVAGEKELEFQWDALSNAKEAKVSASFKQTATYDRDKKKWQFSSYDKPTLIEKSFEATNLDLSQAKEFSSPYAPAMRGIVKIHEMNNDSVVLDWGRSAIEHQNMKFARAKDISEIPLDISKTSWNQSFWYVGEDGYYLCLSFEGNKTTLSIQSKLYAMAGGGHYRAYIEW
ncbi:MAG: hypothetical protein IJN34_07115 [Clostridia bacterium]|nr:hypothetical protein [Clostridia bacterium]